MSRFAVVSWSPLDDATLRGGGSLQMLNGWKSIAAYIGRDERTAMRWAADRGLPVHRSPGPGRGSVYALPDEIDAWLASGREGDQASGVIITSAPTIVSAVVLPWWRQSRWVGPALTITGLLFILVGSITLNRRAEVVVPKRLAFADPAARSAFLQATYDWNLRTQASLTRAAQEYAQAIGRDPQVPAAYVGLANTYLLLREDGSMSDDDAYGRAEAAARAAIALNPQSSEAHRALAFIAFWWRQDRATARREFSSAIALRPEDPLTHHWFANALLANGEAGASLHEIEIARDLDPTSAAVLADRGMIMYVAGQHYDGLSALRAAAIDQPQSVGPHRSLAEIALAEGRAAEFLREAGISAKLRGDPAAMSKVARWAAAGDSAAAIDRAMLEDARTARNGFRVAQLFSLLGDANAARTALAQACTEHEPATISANSDLWLAHALSASEIEERCEHASLIS